MESIAAIGLCLYTEAKSATWVCSMPTYEEVLSLAKRLSLGDQLRLLEALAALSLGSVVVEGTDEVISAEEILDSEAALQDYWAGRDTGITSAALKQKLFGGNHSV
jgi:hypothetical protein